MVTFFRMTETKLAQMQPNLRMAWLQTIVDCTNVASLLLENTLNFLEGLC